MPVLPPPAPRTALVAAAIFAVAGPAVAVARTRANPAPVLLVPVQLHLLRSDQTADLDSALVPADTAPLVDAANRHLLPTGVQLVLDSVAEEQARVPEALGDGGDLRRYRWVRPRAYRARTVFHVYVVRRMPVRGVFLGSDAIFLKDDRGRTSDRRAAMARTLAHEIGHALGLGHRNERGALMASGGRGTRLSSAESATLRRSAQRLKVSVDARDALDRARLRARANRWESARAWLRPLVLLEGDSSVSAEARRLYRQLLPL